MIRAGHLRLLPKPIAKCMPPRAYPPTAGVSLRKSAGSDWLLDKTTGGRTTTLTLTRAELEDIVTMAGLVLATEDT